MHIARFPRVRLAHPPTAPERTPRLSERLGRPGVVERGDVMADTDYVGEGYGLPTQGTIAAIELFARPEGILLDPVHSGKGAIRSAAAAG